MMLRTGVARVYYRALELTTAESPPPVIIPVGLHYDAKRLFGSNALVAFHPPFPTPPPGTSEVEQRARTRRLTDELGRVLHEVVYATESWELHHGLHRTRKILRAERAMRAGRRTNRPDMKERVLDFSRVWAGYNERKRTHPRETEALQSRVFAYDADLRALGLEDHELDSDSSLRSSLRLAASVLAQVLFVFLVLPPLLTIGVVANLPAGATVFAISKWGAREKKDEASLKLILGAIALSRDLAHAGVARGPGCAPARGGLPHVSRSARAHGSHDLRVEPGRRLRRGPLTAPRAPDAPVRSRATHEAGAPKPSTA